MQATLILLALMIVGHAGCSSPQKTGKVATAANTDALSASAKKVEQDFSQTESDFGKLRT